MELPQLMETVRGFQKAQLILTAHRLAIFTTLGQARLSPESLASSLSCSLRGLTILLDALVSLELLGKEEGLYFNQELAYQHLTPEGSDYRGTSFDHIYDLMTVWSRLDESVRSGQACRRPEEHLMSGSPEKNATFMGAMAEMGRPNGRIIATNLDLSPYHTLLDIGGGPGVYSEEILRLNPQMKAVIADLPLTVQTAEGLVAQGEFAERIDFQCIDIFQDSVNGFTGQYDVALISNVLHMEGEEPNRLLLKKVFACLNPGGMIIIHEGIIETGRTAPVDRAMFAINMLVNTARGNCYTFEEMQSWLQDGGFAQIQWVDCFERPSLITAQKP